MAAAIAEYPPVVLVVEDEPLLRLHAVDLLLDAGFAVLEAADADRAIEILSARGDIRIVFTDIDMPGSMDGLRLAIVIRDRWPPVELIITSGKMDLPESSLPARGVFFAKPYDGAKLVHAMRGFVAEC